jgi:C4-type Zn-finger protein
MSDLARNQRQKRVVSCPRCGTAMKEVVSIAPSLGEPGLLGYECPNCVYVTSELLQPVSGTNQHAA